MPRLAICFGAQPQIFISRQIGQTTIHVSRYCCSILPAAAGPFSENSLPIFSSAPGPPEYSQPGQARSKKKPATLQNKAEADPTEAAPTSCTAGKAQASKMSAPPPPPPPPPSAPRQRTPQSPQKSPPPQQQPRPMRTNSYQRYYRGSGSAAAPQTVFGWTPRTPSAPHTPAAGQRSHLGSGSSTRGHTSGASTHSAAAASQPRQASPRISPSAGAAAKQVGVKPSASAVPISSPVAGAQTPSWLKGTYRPQPPPAAAQPTTVASWCKDRLEAIKATVECKSDAVPELRKIMDDLDSTKVANEISVIGGIRKEYWKARERQRKAMMELRRAERDVSRINMHSAHIDGKIARLRSYARFIERGWVDEIIVPTKSKEVPNDKGKEIQSNGSAKEKEPEKDTADKPKDGAKQVVEQNRSSRSFDGHFDQKRASSDSMQIS